MISKGQVADLTTPWSRPLTPNPTRARLSRPAMIGLAALAVIILALVALRVTRKEVPKDPYRTAALEQGAITKSVSASGTLEALVTVEVGSQISGQIRKVLVDFNDVVKAGQVLAVLDPQTYESRVAQGQADIAAGTAALQQAQAQAANAQADFNRKKTLVARGVYSPAVLDQSQASYRVALASVEAARARVGQSQAALRSTRVDLSRTVVVAPIAGVIVDRKIEPGQTVAASFQAPVLFRIAQDLSKVRVKISVDEADIGQVREGQAVRFTVDAFPDESFRGTVSQVRKQPVTEQNVVAYTVMAVADNPRGSLLPGMTANADIILEQRPNVLKAPAAALRWQPISANAPARGGFGPPGMGGPPRPQGGGMGGARLVAQLDLDASQQKAWAPIEVDLRSKMAAAFASAGGDRAAMRETVRRNTTEAMARLEPVLRPDQKEKLRALLATLGQGRAGGMAGGVLFVLRDDKPTPVPVRVGATDGTFTEIRAQDLKAGDQVITGGGPKAKVQIGPPMGGSGRPRT